MRFAKTYLSHKQSGCKEKNQMLDKNGPGLFYINKVLILLPRPLPVMIVLIFYTPLIHLYVKSFTYSFRFCNNV